MSRSQHNFIDKRQVHTNLLLSFLSIIALN